MDAEGMLVFRRVLSRNQNGVGRTDIDFDIGANMQNVVSIDRAQAEAGIRAIAALNVLDGRTFPRENRLVRSRASWLPLDDTVAGQLFRFDPSYTDSSGASSLQM